MGDDFKIEVMGEDAKEDDVLLSDETGTTVTLVRKSNWDEKAFGFRIDDGGGFTGIILLPEQWVRMRDKVDAFLKSRGSI
jgi:hypothetical protein